MTQVVLAQKLDALGRRIPPQGLARLEAGERRVDVDDVLVLALALGVSVETLLAPTPSERSQGVFHAAGNAWLDQEHYRRVMNGNPWVEVDIEVSDERVIRDRAGRTPEEARRIAEKLEPWKVRGGPIKSGVERRESDLLTGAGAALAAVVDVLRDRAAAPKTAEDLIDAVRGRIENATSVTLSEEAMDLLARGHAASTADDEEQGR